ncbi:hypothetical protein [Streptomyces hydrogenans]|uniref:hypothetical protein n=1 Tax=Streptomyces hydrogenans TaxID=1873719 RepID=UPI0035DEF414
MNEIRRLLAKVVHTVRHEAEHIQHWSRWRRRHQYRARLSHYRRRGHRPHICVSRMGPVISRPEAASHQPRATVQFTRGKE